LNLQIPPTPLSIPLMRTLGNIAASSLNDHTEALLKIPEIYGILSRFLTSNLRYI